MASYLWARLLFLFFVYWLLCAKHRDVMDECYLYHLYMALIAPMTCWANGMTILDIIPKSFRYCFVTSLLWLSGQIVWSFVTLVDLFKQFFQIDYVICSLSQTVTQNPRKGRGTKRYKESITCLINFLSNFNWGKIGGTELLINVVRISTQVSIFFQFFC